MKKGMTELVVGALSAALILPYVVGGALGFGSVGAWIAYGVYKDMKESEVTEEEEPKVYGPGIQDIIDAIDRGEFGIVPEEPLTKEEQEARDKYVAPTRVDA